MVYSFVFYGVCVFLCVCLLCFVLFVCSVLFWLVYWSVCFLKREGKIEGLELGEGEDLGGNMVGATMIRIYCMKIIFQEINLKKDILNIERI